MGYISINIHDKQITFVTLQKEDSKEGCKDFLKKIQARKKEIGDISISSCDRLRTFSKVEQDALEYSTTALTMNECINAKITALENDKWWLDKKYAFFSIIRKTSVPWIVNYTKDIEGKIKNLKTNHGRYLEEKKLKAEAISKSKDILEDLKGLRDNLRL